MAMNNDNSWTTAAMLSPYLSSNGGPSPSGLYGSLLNTIPVPLAPEQPRATAYSQVRQAGERFAKTLEKMGNVLPVRNGRVVPADNDLPIGDARRLKLAVLFLDVCGFSQISSFDGDDQDQVLKIQMLFMAEMLQVVKAHDGDFEKNTGDGLMAYFKDKSEAECTQLAVDAAVTMHCYNDEVISPKLKSLGLPEIRFRVGIETGLVTIANVGVRGGEHNSLVAIGNVPNIACKLMTLIPSGGIILGNYTRDLLSTAWQNETKPVGPLPGYVIYGNGAPYPAWELKYRAPNPNWLFSTSGMLGGL